MGLYCSVSCMCEFYIYSSSLLLSAFFTEVIGTALNQNIAKEEFIEVQLNSQTLTDLKEKSKPDHNFSHEFTEREPDSLLQVRLVL